MRYFTKKGGKWKEHASLLHARRYAGLYGGEVHSFTPHSGAPRMKKKYHAKRNKYGVPTLRFP